MQTRRGPSRSAHAAGILALLLTWGCRPADPVAPAPPPVVADDPIALESLADPTRPPAPPGVVALRTRIAALDAIAPPGGDRANPAYANVRTLSRRAAFVLDEYPPFESVLAFAAEELRQAEAWRDALGGSAVPGLAGGTHVEGYWSEVDGSWQPFVRHLPTRRRAAAMPLLVFLHGYSPHFNIVNWSALPSNLVAIAEEDGFALVAPFGRGNTDFQGLGEDDVLRVIDEMQARYTIDADRVVLVGSSMGGLGAWTLGAHHPDRFAGLVIVSARGDYYVWHGLDPTALPVYRRHMIDAEFGGSLIENLAAIPVLSAHGEADPVVLPEEGRIMAERLAAVSPRARHLSFPEAGHDIFGLLFERPDVRAWLRARKREAITDFTYTTGSLRHTRAHWLRTYPRRTDLPLRLTVAATPDGLVVDARPKVSLSVVPDRLPAALRGLPVLAGEDIDVLDLDAGPPAGVARPCTVRDALRAPFLFVRCGDEEDADGEARFRQAVEDWTQFAQAAPRTARAENLREEDLRGRNVFLFGEPETSRHIRLALWDSPVRAEGDDFVVGDVRIPRAGRGLYVVRPSPWDPHCVAVAQCGLAWGAGLPANHKYDFLPDFIVYDDNREFDGGNRPLAAGFFEDGWAIDAASLHLAEEKRL